jgi:ABC-2 type transporter
VFDRYYKAWSQTSVLAGIRLRLAGTYPRICSFSALLRHSYGMATAAVAVQLHASTPRKGLHKHKDSQLALLWKCREISDGLYQVITYLVYKMLSEMAITFVASIIFSSITFFPIRLQGQWVTFWLFYYCTLCCGIGMASFLTPCLLLLAPSFYRVSSSPTQPPLEPPALPPSCPFSSSQHGASTIRWEGQEGNPTCF